MKKAKQARGKVAATKTPKLADLVPKKDPKAGIIVYNGHASLGRNLAGAGSPAGSAPARGVTHDPEFEAWA